MGNRNPNPLFSLFVCNNDLLAEKPVCLIDVGARSMIPGREGIFTLRSFRLPFDHFFDLLTPLINGFGKIGYKDYVRLSNSLP